MEEGEGCRKTISGVFKVFFDRPLPPHLVNQVFPLSLSPDWVMAVDGTWLRRCGVIMIYWNVTDNQCLYWSWETSESYLALQAGLEKVIEEITLVHMPTGAISDWKGAIVSAVAVYCGRIPHQRCLAHVKRDCERLLPRCSPFEATRELRQIAQGLLLVKTKVQQADWLVWLTTWEIAYGSILAERTRPETTTRTKRQWWYTHSNVRRAYRILTKNQNHLFEFLYHPEIPRTNNVLEGINSDLKAKLRAHRGMKADQQFHFVSWYLTFKKVKSSVDLKKLWDRWKKLS